MAEEPRLALLYRRHWDEICGYVRRRFGAGPPEPEDVAQAAFMRLSARADVRDLENPRAFLYRVAHNLAIEERAKNILDKTPITDAFLNSDDTALTTNVFVLDPRLIGLSIRKEF